MMLKYFVDVCLICGMVVVVFGTVLFLISFVKSYIDKFFPREPRDQKGVREMTEKDFKKYENVLAANGMVPQIDKAIQNSAELIISLSKVSVDVDYLNTVVENIANLQTSLNLLKCIFDTVGKSDEIQKDTEKYMFEHAERILEEKGKDKNVQCGNLWGLYS